MIKINLHDYRDELRKVDVQKRVVKASAVVVISLLLILASYMLDQAKIDGLNGEIRQLNAKVQALQPDVKLVKGMMARQERADQIIRGIKGLRVDQLEATRVLGDMSLRVPKEIWLTGYRQMTKANLASAKVPVIYFDNPEDKKSKKRNKRNRNPQAEETNQDFMEITGWSFKEKAVAEYITELEEIPYFRLVFLHKSRREMMGGYPVYRFSLYCYMPKGKENAVT